MTVEAMGWALDSAVPNPAKAVLVALANWSDHEESCFLSIERLAQVASVSPEQVRLELDHLQKSGMIEVRPHHNYQDGALGVRYYLQVGAVYSPAASSEKPHRAPDDGYTEFDRDVIRTLVPLPLAMSVYGLLVLDANPSGISEMSIRAVAEFGGVTEPEIRAALEAILATPYAELLEPLSRDSDRVVVQLRPGIDYRRLDESGEQ